MEKECYELAALMFDFTLLHVDATVTPSDDTEWSRNVIPTENVLVAEGISLGPFSSVF